MPGFDGTGPKGQGPKTNGGFGLRNPTTRKKNPGQPNYGVEEGRIARGCGRGRTFNSGRSKGESIKNRSPL